MDGHRVASYPYDSDDENNCADVVAPFADENYPVRDSDFESDEDDDLFGDRSPGVSPTKIAQRRQEEGAENSKWNKNDAKVCLYVSSQYMCVYMHMYVGHDTLFM
jgi:hypothetical protein